MASSHLAFMAEKDPSTEAHGKAGAGTAPAPWVSSSDEPAAAAVDDPRTSALVAGTHMGKAASEARPPIGGIKAPPPPSVMPTKRRSADSRKEDDGEERDSREA